MTSTAYTGTSSNEIASAPAEINFERKSRFKKVKSIRKVLPFKKKQFSDKEYEAFKAAREREEATLSTKGTTPEQGESSDTDKLDFCIDMDFGSLIGSILCFDKACGVDFDWRNDDGSEMTSDDVADRVVKTLDVVTDEAERLHPEVERVIGENVAYVSNVIMGGKQEEDPAEPEPDAQRDVSEVKELDDEQSSVIEETTYNEQVAVEEMNYNKQVAVKVEELNEQVIEETTNNKEPVLIERAIDDVTSTYNEGVTEASRIYNTKAPVVEQICKEKLAAMEMAVQQSVRNLIGKGDDENLDDEDKKPKSRKEINATNTRPQADDSTSDPATEEMQRQQDETFMEKISTGMKTIDEDVEDEN